MATRNFDEEFDFSSREKVEFVLGGETLKAKPVLHPSIFLEPIEGLDGIVTFIAAALEPESREKFLAMVKDPDVLISAEQVSEVASFIVGELSNRPTESPSLSGSGDGADSNTSKVDSPSQVKTGG